MLSRLQTMELLSCCFLSFAVEMDSLTMCIFLFLIFTVNCEWKDWTSWESCSVTCGNGTQKRTRTPYIAAKYGGLECEGIWHNENDYEYKDCSNDEACSFNCKK